MIESQGDTPLALGFLTVVDQPGQGLVGGYLLLNAHARPLEFHCTVPLRANRAQEVLYGPTLQPYLYGEQIGSTLVKTSDLRPLAVFTDCQPALAAADHILSPLWLVLRPMDDVTKDEGIATESSDAASARRIDSGHAAPAGMALSRCGRNCLARPVASASAAAPEERLLELAATLDLFEPFERIRAAIQESQRGWR